MEGSSINLKRVKKLASSFGGKFEVEVVVVEVG